MVSVATIESGLRLDIDAFQKRGEAGECGLWQVMPDGGRRGTCPATRRELAIIAVDRMRRSFASCRALRLEYRLSVYASGNCEDGHEESEARIVLGQQMFAKRPPPPLEKSYAQN